MDQDLFPFANLNNTDLANLISSNIQHHFPLHVIDSLKYDSFKYQDNDNLNKDPPIGYIVN